MKNIVYIIDITTNHHHHHHNQDEYGDLNPMWRPSIKTNWPISTLTKGSNLVLIVAIIITIHSPQHQHHSQKHILDLIDEECPSKAPQTQGVKYQTPILIEPQRRLVLKLMQITDTASSQIVEPAKVPPKCTEITPKPPIIQLQIPNIWKSTVNCDPSSSSRNELLRLAFAQWPDSSWSFENKYWASFQRQLGGCVWLVRNTLLENIDWGIKERCPISDQNSLRENSCKFDTVSVLNAHKHKWPQKDGKIWDSETPRQSWSDSLFAGAAHWARGTIIS